LIVLREGTLTLLLRIISYAKSSCYFKRRKAVDAH
jgi:hypothetical protein